MKKNPHRPVLVTMPPDWVDAFKEAAGESGETLSGWLAEAGRKRLPAATRKRLSAPRRRGNPKGGAA